MKSAPVKIFSTIFAGFPIHFAENAQKRPNFDASYLGNRCELGGMSPFYKLEDQGYKTCPNKENLKFFGRPPPYRLNSDNTGIYFDLNWPPIWWVQLKLPLLGLEERNEDQ